MKRAAIALLLATSIPLGTASAGEHFACNMGAMTKNERATHEKASRKLFAAVQEEKELADGFAFRLPADELTTAAQWVALESKCCPFFRFEIELGKDQGPLWLRIKGSDGIKPFIRAEFGLDAV